MDHGRGWQGSRGGPAEPWQRSVLAGEAGGDSKRGPEGGGGRGAGKGGEGGGGGGGARHGPPARPGRRSAGRDAPDGHARWAASEHQRGQDLDEGGPGR